MSMWSFACVSFVVLLSYNLVVKWKIKVYITYGDVRWLLVLLGLKSTIKARNLKSAKKHHTEFDFPNGILVKMFLHGWCYSTTKLKCKWKRLVFYHLNTLEWKVFTFPKSLRLSICLSCTYEKRGNPQNISFILEYNFNDISLYETFHNIHETWPFSCETHPIH